MGLPPKKPNAHLTLREKERILTLKDEGYKPSTIWRKIKIPRSTISSFLNRHAKTDNSTLVRKPGSGAKKKLSARAERALVRIAINDPRMTLKALLTPSKSGKQLNHHIVAKILKRHNKAKRRPRKKPYLTIRYKKLRRVHSRFELKIKRNPRKVIWSNEVTFEIGEDLINFWVTRGPRRD
jgi:transposase